MNSLSIKKILAVIMIAFLFAGCSDDDDNNPGSSNGDPNKADGIFAELIVGRTIYQDIISIAFDGYTARLDSCYAPCVPVCPVNSATVTCNATPLTWEPITQTYLYTNMSLVAAGQWYKFEVSGTGVSALVDSIQFPDHMPYLTNPQYEDTVTKGSDINVTWDDAGSGNVEIIITSAAGDSLFFVETDNDGAYTVNSASLAQMPAGELLIVLNHYNRKNIVADDYDSRSIIAARVISSITFYLKD